MATGEGCSINTQRAALQLTFALCDRYTDILISRVQVKGHFHFLSAGLWCLSRWLVHLSRVCCRPSSPPHPLTPHTLTAHPVKCSTQRYDQLLTHKHMHTCTCT